MRSQQNKTRKLSDFCCFLFLSRDRKMSKAMDRMEPSGFRGGGVAVFELSPIISDAKAEEANWCSSTSTSSIGRNSDLSRRSSLEGEDGGENEVQSSYKGPLNMLDSLEEVLPIRRGISSFYGGKSKSFTSLAEASSTSSIKDIAKQENAYTRRRRNLLAINHVRDKSRSNGCGISKRPIISSRSTLALAVGLSSSESIASTSDDSASRSPPQLPPRHRGPQSRGSSRRSYSVVDLQRCTTDVASNSF
ncbi:uncharacterized protein LOC123200664 [Mangifera indica]|uniref:uncharacterized protein LOC123200664 n=1 Tax=Mangifera indica TaxID=29780 RepID=UPI001CFC03EB|nr:uncharacterized protein LOC123200664 [Mangifera indica]